MPLHLVGSLANLHVRCPTVDEVKDDFLRRIGLSLPYGWDPYEQDTLSVSAVTSKVCQTSHLLSTFSFNSIALLRSNTRSAISPELLYSLWGIGLDTTRQILRATTQEYTRSTDNLNRRYKTTHHHS